MKKENKMKNAKKKPKAIRVLLRIFLGSLFMLSVIVLIGGLAFAIYVDRKIEKHIDETMFTMLGSDSASIYRYESDENGKRKAVEIPDAAIYGGYRCVYAEYDTVPQDMIDAFVSIEDKRFYSHDGVDWFRTVSAGFNYFLKFNGSYGGSTITQQLIKNVTDKADYSFQRKIQEIFWAIDLETKMDKKEIMGLYLNIINLSHGCYGVRTAANYYYSKELSELTLSECATIAAITNNPSYYDPVRNPENNKTRRDLILSQMLEQEYITEEEYNNAISDGITLNVNAEMSNNTVNSWYVDMVIEDVINDLMVRKGYSRTMAGLIVYTGGLKIYTAMDADVQKVLDEYYSDPDNFYSGISGETPQSSMIIIDSVTGDVLGVAGAIGEKNANRIQNFATQTLRPAGSVIKPLSVYAPALEDGVITWGTVYDDVPVNFGKYNLDKNQGAIIEPVAWPQNSNRIYRGLTNINYAIEHSVNTVAVKVLEDIGIDRGFDFLYNKLHMKSLIESKTLSNGSVLTDKDYAALALGQFNYGVTLKEVTAAYSIFANQGIYNKTRSYYKVTDANGSVILENQYYGEAVIKEETASLMTLMLENVLKNGSATDITLDERIDCAGKTGTTQKNYDKWFIGYTPYFIGGVWCGYEYPKSLSNINGNVCVKVWDEVMTLLHKKYIKNGDAKNFSIDPDVAEYEYCRDSGMLVTEACLKDARGDRTEKGYFEKGTEPTEYCTCHRLVEYDKVNGGIAFDDCPSENTELVGMIVVNRSFPMQIYVTDAQYVFRDIGTDIIPETSPKLPFFNNLYGENEYSGISNTKEQYNRSCRDHFNYFTWKKKQEESTA